MRAGQSGGAGRPPQRVLKERLQSRLASGQNSKDPHRLRGPGSPAGGRGFRRRPLSSVCPADREGDRRSVGTVGARQWMAFSAPGLLWIPGAALQRSGRLGCEREVLPRHGVQHHRRVRTLSICVRAGRHPRRGRQPQGKYRQRRLGLFLWEGARPHLPQGGPEALCPQTVADRSRRPQPLASVGIDQEKGSLQ